MTTISTLPVPSAGLALRHAALPLLFLQFGLLCGTWASRIPAVRDLLQLGPATLSAVLLCGGLGAVCAFPLATWMMRRFGGRRTTFHAGFGLLASMACLAFASNGALLMAALFLFGAMCGCFDVGVNSVSTRLESDSGRSILSMMHAWFCVGAFAGAISGSAMAGLAVAPRTHFLWLSLSLLLPMWCACCALPDDGPQQAVEQKKFGLPRGPLVLLGFLGFFGAISEGSISDWSGIFMKDHLGVGDGLAPIALTAFSLMMLCIRIVGDRIKRRVGARRLLVVGALGSACGLFCATFAGSVPLAIAGFGVAGAGLALVFPFVFSAAGRLGATELAGVATLSYSGSLIGPPAMGVAAQYFGLPAAIGLLGLLSLGIAAVANRARLLD